MAIKHGYSLVELTVVIGLICLLTLAISSIMLTSILSSNRIRTATKTKQSGSYAISQIQGLIRNAKNINVCDSDNGIITLTSGDGGVTTIIAENNNIASNSGIYLNPPNTTTSSFNVTCNPSDTDPSFIQVSFDLQSNSSSSTKENPLLHFETSVDVLNN
jgi:type II secretory pathway pseudopilin PulG